MTLAPQDIQGVTLRELTTLADERGAFTETFRRTWLPADRRDVAQSNFSRSRAGVLRGMHFHRRQTDWWVVLDGTAFVALCDLREGAATHGKVATVTITVEAAAGLRALRIPPGVAHGFCALTDVILQYLVDTEYDGSDEEGFAWDDPGAGIPWPLEHPVVSDRDAHNPPLASVLGVPPPSGG